MRREWMEQEVAAICHASGLDGARTTGLGARWGTELHPDLGHVGHRNALVLVQLPGIRRRLRKRQRLLAHARMPALLRHAAGSATQLSPAAAAAAHLAVMVHVHV
jgi:hypothetical protein